MSIDVVLTLYAAFDAHDDAAVERLIAPGFALHQSGQRLSLDRLRIFRAAYAAAFTDLRTTPTVLHDGHAHVVCATVTTGRHTGTFLGHPATGRSFRATGLDVFRLEDDRIAEQWAEFDTFGMLLQLGIRGTS